MEFFGHNTDFRVSTLAKFCLSIALLLSLVSFVSLFTKGLNFGLEFSGGTQVELRFANAVAIEQVKDDMQELGYNARVQHFGSTQDVLLRIVENSAIAEGLLREQLASKFASTDNPAEIRRIDYVGAEVGSQLAEQGALAVIIAILATMAYIAMRFEYKFAISAALSLMHDALLVLGVFVLFNIEFELSSLAAILAVVGYSLNDKIVVFDRVRENFRRAKSGKASEIMDGAINQTLSRTIMTSFLTLLVVVALLVFGGESLWSFSLALCLGIAIGTYSSIFVASNLSLALGLERKDLLPKPKTVVDNLP